MVLILYLREHAGPAPSKAEDVLIECASTPDSAGNHSTECAPPVVASLGGSVLPSTSVVPDVSLCVIILENFQESREP